MRSASPLRQGIKGIVIVHSQRRLGDGGESGEKEGGCGMGGVPESERSMFAMDLSARW